MVIYADALFALNLALNYALLLASARVAGAEFVRLRLLGAALFGAAYAVAVYLPGLGFLALGPIKLAAGLLMALLAYGGMRRFGRMVLIFLALSAALGGGILALSMTAGGGGSLPLAGGAAELKTVLLAAAVCYFLVSTVFRRFLRHAPGREVTSVRLRVEGREVTFSVLLDTGNTLEDERGRPVLVAWWKMLSELFPAAARPGQEDVRHPDAGMTRLGALWDPRRLRLLPYRAVGVECGMLLALRVDELELGGARRKNALVALAPGPVTDGGSYEGVIGGAWEDCGPRRGKRERSWTA